MATYLFSKNNGNRVPLGTVTSPDIGFLSDLHGQLWIPFCGPGLRSNQKVVDYLQNLCAAIAPVGPSRLPFFQVLCCSLISSIPSGMWYCPQFIISVEKGQFHPVLIPLPALLAQSGNSERVLLMTEWVYPNYTPRDGEITRMWPSGLLRHTVN